MKAPTFQHRHYVKIAETIALLPTHEGDSMRQLVAHTFAAALADTNPHFDRGRFIAAAMGNPSNGRDKRKSR